MLYGYRCLFKNVNAIIAISEVIDPYGIITWQRRISCA